MCASTWIYFFKVAGIVKNPIIKTNIWINAGDANKKASTNDSMFHESINYAFSVVSINTCMEYKNRAIN